MSKKNYSLSKFRIFAAANVLCGMSLYGYVANADVSLPYNTPTVIVAWGVCYVVTNYSGSTKFVPTTAAAEWSSFYTTPGTASLSACAPPGDGGGCCVGNGGGDSGG
jgi:hypothetical protein